MRKKKKVTGPMDIGESIKQQLTQCFPVRQSNYPKSILKDSSNMMNITI